MSSLSKRARALVASPPLAPYIREHFARADPYDPTSRPDGYIPLCIAENARCTRDLLRRLHRHVARVEASVLGYDAMVGNLGFRERLAAFMGRTFLGRRPAPEQLAVLAGAGTVLEQLFFALADPGDVVLVPTPSYAGFWADLETRDGLVIEPVERPEDDGFALRLEHLDDAVRRAPGPVKALLFTNPDNPLGTVVGGGEVAAIHAWAERRRIHVVFDEIYALSHFGSGAFASVASVTEALGPFAHIVWAFSKDFGASGLRCGVLMSENDEVLEAVDQLAYWGACSGHTVALLSHFIDDQAEVDAFLTEMRADLASTYARVTEALERANLPFVDAEAGFFLLCDLRGHLEAASFEAEHTLWRRLLDDHNLNLTPGRACRIATPGFFRLCYAGVDDDALDVALARLRDALGR
ncbi:MAG: aminotransferase class I/II-fold pyridoxal phosphate-dependent enzyme [Myxococcota bacterium]